MSRDPRAQELNNLKLALATFALQLDAFEARLRTAHPVLLAQSTVRWMSGLQLEPPPHRRAFLLPIRQAVRQMS
jgi:hypothetical protein